MLGDVGRGWARLGEVGRGWARLGDVLDGIKAVLITMEANRGITEHLIRHKCNKTRKLRAVSA